MGVFGQLALAGLFGGLLALERRAFLQAMFSRPLVACILMAFAMGHPYPSLGVWVGLVLEWYHLDSASLGAALPENETLAATSATACAVSWVSVLPQEAVFTLALLVGLAMGHVGRWVERKLEPYAQQSAQNAQRLVEEKKFADAMRQHRNRLWLTGVVFGLLTATVWWVSQQVAPWLELFPTRLVRGLSFAYLAMVVVAAGRALQGMNGKKSWVMALAGGTLTLAFLKGVVHVP